MNSVYMKVKEIRENLENNISKLKEKARNDIDECLKKHYNPNTKPKTVSDMLEEQKRNWMRIPSAPYENLEEGIQYYIQICEKPSHPLINTGHKKLYDLYRIYGKGIVRQKLKARGH
jgi:hypothetical protein